MARKRYTRLRCKARLAGGKQCRKLVVDGLETCGIKAHQAQLATRKTATRRARVTRRAPRKPAPRTLAQQKAFVTAYAELGIITDAAAAARIDRRRHYEWLEDSERYPHYGAQFDDAYEQASDLLEAEAIRRGLEGWLEPKYGRDKGKDAGTVEVGTIRRFSDRLLELVLKQRRPSFRERPVQVGVGVNATRVEIILPDNGLRRDSQLVLD